MSNKILLKRSSVANAIPSAANVSIGELALNTREGKLYTKISDGVSDSIFELTQNQLITLSGDATGNGISTIPVLLNSAQANITSLGSLTSLTVVGNINGSNAILSGDLSSNNISVTSTIGATGNITGGNLNTAGQVVATGNVTGGNIVTVGQVTATGNISGNYFIGNGRFLDGIDTTLISNGTTEVRTYENGNVAFTISGTSNVVLVTTDGIETTGNANVGNINVTSAIYSDTADVTGNVTGGNLNTAGQVVATGNISGGNVNTAGLIVATGNISGGNVNTAGQVVATGNITGGNIISSGLINAATTIDATGNITGGNIITSGELFSGTLRTTGNALINGNLTIQGNLTYINIDDLRVEDPIIILGTGPNGTPLTSNDGLDRGVYLEYYTSSTGNAFVGWQNATGNMIIASDVSFASNDVVQVNSYGTLQAGNAYLESAVVVGNITGGNISTSGTFAVTGNLDAGNLNTSGQVVATGNITGGNLNTSGQLVATGNVNGGNLISVGNAVVNAILTDNYYYANGTPLDMQQPAGANTEIQFNLDGDFGASNKFTWNSTTDVLTVTGNINAANMSTTTLAATGNVTGSNLNTSGRVVATGNVTGGNVTTVGQVAATGNVTGGNINTAGQVVATGNITGGNLSGTSIVGTLTTASQPNITSVGTLVSLSVTGNINSGNLSTGIGDFTTINVSTLANITSTTTSTSTTTGALIVAGGVGVAGNIYATTIYENGSEVLNVDDIIDGGSY
jgi:hypothetical protein